MVEIILDNQPKQKALLKRRALHRTDDNDHQASSINFFRLLLKNLSNKINPNTTFSIIK